MSLQLTYILKQAFLPGDNIQKSQICLYGALQDNSQLNALYIFGLPDKTRTRDDQKIP